LPQTNLIYFEEISRKKEFNLDKYRYNNILNSLRIHRKIFLEKQYVKRTMLVFVIDTLYEHKGIV